MKKMMFFLILIATGNVFSYDFYTFGEISKDLTRFEYGINSDLNWYNSVIGAGIEQKIGENIKIYTDVEQETYMISSGTLSFSPRTQDYYVRGGVWYGPFYAQIQHVCYHVVDDYDPRFRGGHTRMTLGFDSRKK